MTKRKKIGLVITAPFIAVIIFYISAIVVRQYVVPLYAEAFYKHSVEVGFSQSFNALDAQFNALGFDSFRTSVKSGQAKSKATCFNRVTDNGQNGYYEGFSETVPCSKYISIEPFVPDDEFIAKWRTDAEKLLPILKANGWQMTSNFVAGSELGTRDKDQQSIAKIFDVPNRSPANEYAAEIDYERMSGKVTCFLSLKYANNGPSPVKSVWLDEHCQRDVSFFGSSSG